MKIDFPDHPKGDILKTPWWLFWKPAYRRRHWCWTIDHKGCNCDFYWQFLTHGEAFAIRVEEI